MDWMLDNLFFWMKVIVDKHVNVAYQKLASIWKGVRGEQVTI